MRLKVARVKNYLQARGALKKGFNMAMWLAEEGLVCIYCPLTVHPGSVDIVDLLYKDVPYMQFVGNDDPESPSSRRVNVYLDSVSAVIKFLRRFNKVTVRNYI